MGNISGFCRKWEHKTNSVLSAYQPPWEDRVHIIDRSDPGNPKVIQDIPFQEFSQQANQWNQDFSSPPELEEPEQYQGLEQHEKSKREDSGLDITSNPEHWVKMKNITNPYNPLSIWYW